MNRRAFLRLTPFAATATAAGARPAWPTRAAAPRTSRRVSVPAFGLAEATLEQLQALQQAGRQTAVTLTKAYLARIEAVDRRGPALNSVIELNPEALAIPAYCSAS